MQPSYTPPSPSPSIRRPLGSSPLTGPSLNLTPDGRILELNLDSTGPRPSRIASTPNLPTLEDPMPKRTSSSPNVRAGVMMPPHASLPSPPPSPHAQRRPKSRDSYPVPLPKHDFGLHIPRVYAGARSLPPSPSVSRTNLANDEFWTTFPPPPKFSRLSMDPDKVVMPISARERRRMTTPVSSPPQETASDTPNLEKRKSITSLFSKASFSSLPALPPSNPSSIRSSPKSLRQSGSIRSLRSVRSSGSNSTTASDYDVIAELQGELGSFIHAREYPSDDEGTPTEEGWQPKPLSYAPQPTGEKADPIMKSTVSTDRLPLPVIAPRRISSLTGLSNLLPRSSFRSSRTTHSDETITAVRPQSIPDSIDLPITKPILATTVRPKHHRKGASFLSLTSSEDHESESDTTFKVPTAPAPIHALPQAGGNLLTPPAISIPTSPAYSDNRRTLTPSSSSSSSNEMLTPTPTPKSTRRTSKAMILLGIEDDVPSSQKHSSWNIDSESVSAARRLPRQSVKAMAVLGISDSSHLHPESSTGNSVNRFFRSFTRGKKRV